MSEGKSTKGRVFSEVAPVGQGSLLREEVHHMEHKDFVSTVEAYITLNALQKVVETRLNEIKPVLHEAVESLGETVEGTPTLDVEGHRLVREKRTSSAPDDVKLRALMETRGVNLLDAFDAVQTLVLNPSKLQFLIDTGKLAKDDVEALRKVTWAIKAVPNEELREACDIALGVAEKGQPEKAQRKTRKR